MASNFNPAAEIHSEVNMKLMVLASFIGEWIRGAENAKKINEQIKNLQVLLKKMEDFQKGEGSFYDANGKAPVDVCEMNSSFIKDVARHLDTVRVPYFVVESELGRAKLITLSDEFSRAQVESCRKLSLSKNPLAKYTQVAEVSTEELLRRNTLDKIYCSDNVFTLDQVRQFNTYAQEHNFDFSVSYQEPENGEKSAGKWSFRIPQKTMNRPDLNIKETLTLLAAFNTYGMDSEYKNMEAEEIMSSVNKMMDFYKAKNGETFPDDDKKIIIDADNPSHYAIYDGMSIIEYDGKTPVATFNTADKNVRIGQSAMYNVLNGMGHPHVFTASEYKAKYKDGVEKKQSRTMFKAEKSTYSTFEKNIILLKNHDKRINSFNMNQTVVQSMKENVQSNAIFSSFANKLQENNISINDAVNDENIKGLVETYCAILPLNDTQRENMANNLLGKCEAYRFTLQYESDPTALDAQVTDMLDMKNPIESNIKTTQPIAFASVFREAVNDVVNKRRDMERLFKNAVISSGKSPSEINDNLAAEFILQNGIDDPNNEFAQMLGGIVQNVNIDGYMWSVKDGKELAIDEKTSLDINNLAAELERAMNAKEQASLDNIEQTPFDNSEQAK